MLLIFASCQAKQGAAEGGLISGHVQTTNKFTLQTPLAKTFVEAEVISLTLSFPFDMIVDDSGGSPRLRITVGTNTRYANLATQSNPRLLVFEYEVAAGEIDSNGIEVNALELNGSIIQFDKSGVLTNCDITTVTSKTFGNTKVDTLSPAVSDFDLINLPGFYNVGEKIRFSVTFNEIVNVTGTPSVSIDLNSGGPAVASYVTGSGSTLLVFEFQVSATMIDTNGFNSISNSISLNAGTIKDSVGNSANLDITAFVAGAVAYSSSVKINGQLPSVISVTAPPNATYTSADNLDFILEFDREVVVSGIPYLLLTIGSTQRQAQYVSGDGSRELIFRYTAIPGDVDLDGIQLQAQIYQNAGDIVDYLAPAVSYFSDALNNAFTVPGLLGVKLNAIQPQPVSLTRNLDTSIPVWGGTSADNIWIIGQELNLTVGFNTGMYVNQSNGTPTLPVTIGGTTRQATYLSGGNGQTALVFRYVIQESDLDSDGTLGIGNIVLNGGVITDSENTNSLLVMPVNSLVNTFIDGVRPTISSVTAPANGTYSQVAPLNAGAMSFNVTWSEPVNYSDTANGAAFFELNIGGAIVNAEWAVGNNQATIAHRPTTLAGRNDNNGIGVSSPLEGTAIVKDQAGNNVSLHTFSPPVTTSILVDTTAPTVSSITQVTANGTYRTGQNLDFSVTFNESVTTVANASYPRISINVGGNTRYLVATTSTTNTTHTFRYTIQSGDLDSDGVSVGNSVQSNGTTAYARDGGRNNATGTFTPPNTTLLLVDAVGPSISSRTPSANKAYVSGETIQISVTFAEAVTVDTTGGTPWITVDFDQGTDNLAYASGSGTTTLIFSRLIGATHFDMTGLPTTVSAIALNGGTIRDSIGNDAVLTFTSLDLSSIFVTYPEVKLWVRSNLVNMAPTGGASITSSGASTTQTCGSGTCRIFDGDDSLSVAAPMNGIDSVLMAIQTPNALNDYDIFDNAVTLDWDGISGTFDIVTANATLVLNNVSQGMNTTHNVNLAPNSLHILQVEFQSSENFPNGALIPLAYSGSVGEVVAISGVLAPSKLDNIRNYLDGRY